VNNQDLVFTSGSDSPEIRTHRLDRDSGELTLLHTASAGPGSGYLAFAPGGRFVYGINRRPSRALAWAVEEDGRLRALNEVTIPEVHGATHLAVHPGGRLLAVAHFGSGHVSMHALAADGSVGAALQVQVTPPEAHQVVFTPDGRFLFTPCRAGDVVCQFRVDVESGRIAPSEPFQVPAAAGAGPRHMALHPGLHYAFVLNELDGTLTSFRLGAGLLTPLETVPSAPAGFSEKAAAHVEVHGSGKFVYGSNRDHNSVAVWAFDESQARLRLLGHEPGSGLIKGPRDFSVDGDLLLLANQKSDQALVFRIGTDGLPSLQKASLVQQGATFIRRLPAGR
jgi:6-phosphogluconolactonase